MFGGLTNKCAVYIDAANLFYMANQIELRIDYGKFKKLFMRRDTKVVWWGYYTAVDETPDGNRRIQPLLDWLMDKGGYNVVTKMAKSWVQVDGVRKVKGNMDIEIAIDALRMCQYVDEIVLVTGDGDFTPLVHELQSKGVPVTVVASRQGGMLATMLRNAAARVIDLADPEVQSQISAHLAE